VINLLLISGCASTWASLSTGGLKALAAVQLFLSSIICFIAIISMALGIHKILKRRRERKEGEKSKSNPEINSEKSSNEVHIHVETTRETGEQL
jgi:choline-glycine betaine transporter